MLKNKILIAVIFIQTFISLSFSQTGNNEQLTVKGYIYDASTKLPLEGINITVTGYSSAFSNEAGEFNIKVPDYNVTLIADGFYYQKKYVNLQGKNEITIYLYETKYLSFHKNADFYNFQKPLIYCSQGVSIYDNTDGWKNTGTSAENVFDGKVPGLNVISRSGTPGIGSDIFIRGYSSLNCMRQPLIIVDGYLYDFGQYGESIIDGFQVNPLASIDVDDIENVTVVKDASTNYGAKASQGVIFIRTNHATSMETQIEASTYGGYNYAPKGLPLLNGPEYREYLYEILQTSSNFNDDDILKLPFFNDNKTNNPLYYRYHQNTDWQKEVFTNSYNQNYRLKIKGGDEIALYALSLGYKKHDGILKNTDYSKFSLRFNSDINITKKLIVNSNVSLAYNDYKVRDEYNYLTGPIQVAMIKSPLLSTHVISEFGTVSPNIEDADIFGISNPVAIVDNIDGRIRNYRVFGSFNANYKINENLKISDLIGISYEKSKENIFKPDLGIGSENLQLAMSTNSVAQKVEKYFSLYNDFRIVYNRRFSYRHGISALAGTRLTLNDVEGDWGKDYNTPNDEIRSLGNGIFKLKKIGGYTYKWNNLSYYLTTGYDYLQKYFIDFNLSLDGSSRFGDEAKGITLFSSKFGVFPTVSLAWLASSEKFMKPLSFIDVLKFRTSYGINGNDNIGDYNSKRYYVVQNLMGASGIIPGNLWNPAIQWESVRKFDVGADISILKERFSLSFDYFNHLTYDLLNSVKSETVVAGTDEYLINKGSFSTNGYELSINSRIINTSFKWDIGLNISHYKSKIIDFYTDKKFISFLGAYIITQKGQPLGLFYGYKTKGVYSTQEEAETYGLKQLMSNTSLMPFSAGDVIFDDADNNKIIDANDMQVIGDPNPDYTGMITNKFSYKGISLDFAFSFSYGNDIYNYQRRILESMNYIYNQTEAVNNRWRADGDVTNIPKAVLGDPIRNSRFSDRWIEDGSYIRLKYITLSYAIPKIFKFMKGTEIFVSGQNLLTFTKYLGLDPEFSIGLNPLLQGIDLGQTPQSKSVFAGIKVQL
jgi:TonB-linked SusC/RagA family outer membrane protein